MIYVVLDLTFKTFLTTKSNIYKLIPVHVYGKKKKIHRTSQKRYEDPTLSALFGGTKPWVVSDKYQMIDIIVT